jgi:uncharacterized membrane protein HdeD (DUF308 family)
MKKALAAKKSKKPGYFWDILGLLFGIAMFFISINKNEKGNANGKITYNDEGLVHFQSYWLDAFFGLLIIVCCLISIYYKKRNSLNEL